MSSVWGDIPTWLGVIGAAIAFIVGRREYRDVQEWRRSEFLAAEIDRFFAEPRVATALLLIDYSEIRLDADGRRARARTPDTVVLTDAVLIRALQVHTEFENDTESFDPVEMMAREAFDELLTGLERFDQHIKTGLIDASNAEAYLGYWVDKLSNPGSQWKPAEFYTALARFIDVYEYRGVAHLFETFGRPLPAGLRHAHA